MTAYISPVVDSTTIFKSDVFKGKVLFCTGGGSGICKAMTEAVVSVLTRPSVYYYLNIYPDASWCRCDDCWKKVCGMDILFNHCSLPLNVRLDRLLASAEELSKATGRRCIAAQADVRDPKQLHEAVSKAIKEYGKIDFVICGKLIYLIDFQHSCHVIHLGAAGNFLAPISGLSENGFKTVLEIDTVRRTRHHLVLRLHLHVVLCR